MSNRGASYKESFPNLVVMKFFLSVSFVHAFTIDDFSGPIQRLSQEIQLTASELVYINGTHYVRITMNEFQNLNTERNSYVECHRMEPTESFSSFCRTFHTFYHGIQCMEVASERESLDGDKQLSPVCNGCVVGTKLRLHAAEESSLVVEEASLKFTVPQGKNGAVVVNPRSRKRVGTSQYCCSSLHLDTLSCSQGTLGYHEMALNDETDFDELPNPTQFVEGVYRLCVSDSYPVPKCTGDGFLR
jgi:hypothetical protein